MRRNTAFPSSRSFRVGFTVSPPRDLNVEPSMFPHLTKRTSFVHSISSRESKDFSTHNTRDFSSCASIGNASTSSSSSAGECFSAINFFSAV